jgi:hypothetical protein
MQKTAAFIKAAVGFIQFLALSKGFFDFLEILFNAVCGQRRVGADGNGKLDVLPLGEGLAPVKELFQLHVNRLVDNPQQAVNKHMGDIIVFRVQAADKPFEKLVTGKPVVGCLYQTGSVGNFMYQLLPFFYYNDFSVLLLYSRFYELNQLLCFAAALEAHDDFDHKTPLSPFLNCNSFQGVYQP